MGSMSDQVKQPYISIFDALGNQLATNMDKGNTVVTRFVYKYDDEDDDKCIIKMQTTDPKLFDRYSIGRGSRLQFIWGYVGGPMGFAATVVVRDISSVYGETEISTELECADYLTYLKTARADDTDNSTIISYIKSQCHKKYNIEIRSAGETIFRQIKESVKKNQYYPGISKYNEKYQPFNPIEQLVKPFNKMAQSDFDLMDEELIKEGKWFIPDSDEIKTYMEKELPIVSSNRSQLIVLQDLLKACPKGPWFVTGRGDTLLVHNRNMGKEPNRVYRYKSGIKLTVNAKTKYENFEQQSLSVTGMDPEEMKNYYLDSYREALYKMRSFKEIVNDKSLSDDEFKNEVKNYIKMRNETYHKFAIQVDDVGFFQTRTEEFGFIPMKFDNPWFNHGASGVAIRDNTGEIKPDPLLRSKDETFNKDEDKLVLRAKWYTTPLMTYSEIKTYADNNQRALEMDKEEATVVLEGDPFLQSQMTIVLSNLQKQHEGNYYIKTCQHTIDQNGYETSIDCIKVTPDSIINNAVKEIPFNDIDAEKQYKTEKRLFGEEVMFNYTGLMGDPNVSLQGIPKTVGVDSSLSLEQLISEGNEDEMLDKILSAKKAGNIITIKEYKGEDV